MTAQPLEARRRRNLAEDVADHLRDAILTGQLRPGTRIDQDAIAEQLGVSRLPVREALIALDQEGLIRTIPRRGSYVQQLRRDDIADHYQLFGRVAGLAAARAAERITDAELAELDALHAAMETSIDPLEQERLNFDFHRIVNQAANSRRVTSILRLLTRSLPSHYFEFVPDWLDQARSQHGEILEAIRRRDADAAQAAMERHLNESARYAIAALERMDFFED